MVYCLHNFKEDKLKQITILILEKKSYVPEKIIKMCV